LLIDLEGRKPLHIFPQMKETMETRYAVIHISFPYETRLDDEMDEMIQERLEPLYTRFEYLGSETDLEVMEKTSTYVIKYAEDVEHIIDDVLDEVMCKPMFNEADFGCVVGMTQEEAEQEGYSI